MSIAFDASVAADNSPGYSSTTVTWSHTCTGSNRILFVHVRGDTSDNVTGVTYAGVSMTLIDKVFVATNRWQYLFYLIAPATGSNSCIATASTSIAFLVESASYTGARQSGQPDSKATNTGSSVTTLTFTTTTVADNCWMILAVGASNGGLTASTGSFLRRIGTNTGSAIFDSNSALTPAGSKSMIVNCTSGAINGIIASFSPPSIGPANLKSYNTNLKANIKSIDTNLIANIKSINTNA